MTKRNYKKWGSFPRFSVPQLKMIRRVAWYSLRAMRARGFDYTIKEAVSGAADAVCEYYQ